MPELPEVETVKNGLIKKVLNKKITSCKVLYQGIIAYPDKENFIKEITNQTIFDIKRRGKFLLFELDDYYLISHLRMEGKYFIKNPTQELNKHDHVVFTLDKKEELRYNDTRKFGKMHLVKKDELNNSPLSKLGKEPWDETLTKEYLKEKLNKKKAIKTLLLDQTIIVGIGNIYADEILFLSKINPETPGSNLTSKNLLDIIDNTKKVLEKAIEAGGTTIHTYTSVDGITGMFQQELSVHNKKDFPCPECKTKIIKIVVNGRGTYYCPKCQK
ncbi:MAG: DNA-formamidopyrimidine glycosylase [Bacilli bacterium]|nr:DNA-formamidopyrimidine glycosylase [Bacilli bacterium]